MLKIIGSVALIAGSSSMATPTNIFLKCEMASAVACEKDGCRVIPPKITTYMASYTSDSKSNGYYYRCTAEGCSTHKPVIATSGQFTIFSLPESGLVAKLGLQNEVTDIATLMDVVLINRGRCIKSPPPPIIGKIR